MVLCILGPPYCGIGSTIRIGRENRCLPYSGCFFVFFLQIVIVHIDNIFEYIDENNMAKGGGLGKWWQGWQRGERGWGNADNVYKKGGGVVGETLTKADKGGRGGSGHPTFLVDKICEQPLITVYEKNNWSPLNINVFFEM